MIKKISFILGLMVCQMSYGSLDDCLNAGKYVKDKDIIKYCSPYVKSHPVLSGLLGFSYDFLGQYHLSEKYLSEYITFLKQQMNLNEDGISGLGSAYKTLGNLYYFKLLPGGYEKGLDYIMKAAMLGNAVAQGQLGNFYSSEAPKVTKNFPASYMWATLATINGNKKAKNHSFIFQQYDKFKAQAPYCIALGQGMVGQAYAIGMAGLDQSYDKAADWMDKAYDMDPHLAIVNLDYAKVLYDLDDLEDSFKLAKRAVHEPYAAGMQYLGIAYLKGMGTEKDAYQAYIYLKLAEYYYQHPNHQYWLKYDAPCRPDYTQKTDGFGMSYVRTGLSKIHLSADQKKKAEIEIATIKQSFMSDHKTRK